MTMPGKFNAFGPAFCEQGTCRECDVLRAKGRRELGVFFGALLLAAGLMCLLASQAHADVLLGAPVADAGHLTPEACAALARMQATARESSALVGSDAGPMALPPECVDAGPDDAGPVDVPLIAHVDAGDPSPLTGDVLNTAAERNLLAAHDADAGAAAVPDASCASTIASVATFLAGVGLGVYLHQRVTH